MTYETILIERPADGVLRVSMNRPESMNAINDRMEQELDDAFRDAESDAGVRAVILTGAGDRAFSAGYDIEDDGSSAQDYTVTGTGPYLNWWHDKEEKHRHSLLRIWDLSKPVIAAVNGYAIAGGCEYAMMCDVTIASENAKFGEPEIRHASGPPTLIMPWIVGWKQAKRLLLTGDVIDAHEALRIGLVSSVVTADELQEQAVMLAERMARIPPLAMKWNKMAINRSVEQMGMKQGLETNTLLTIFAHTAHGSGVSNREELQEARSAGGLRGYLKARDGWFNEQAKKLKV